MSRIALPLLFILLLTPATSAEVIIETSLEPIDLEAAANVTMTLPLEQPESSLLTKGGVPLNGIWLVPFAIDDTTPDASSTLFAMRNESGAPVDVSVDYYDARFNLLTSEMFTLAPDQVQTRNLRAIPALINPGNIAEGVVQFLPNGQISVDFFQLDVAGNFATGNLGLDESDFCTDWMARFVRFPGSSEGSRITFLVNGPLGAGGGPTVSGNVYDEPGNFVNSFTITTDDWFFEVVSDDLVVGATNFGSMEITLNTLIVPRGTIYVEHSAFGLYSLGTRAICKDLPSI